MIDWNRVNELRSEIGEEDFSEIVEIFLEEVEEVISKLETAPELAAMAKDLHFLKGGALNLGFSGFSSLCQAGETMSNEGHPENVDIGKILDMYRSSKETFQAGLAG